MIPCFTSPIPHVSLPQRPLLPTAVFLRLLISMFLNNKYLLLYFTVSILDAVYWFPLMVDEDLDLLHHHPILFPVHCTSPGS